MRWQNIFVTFKFTGLLFLVRMSRNEAKEPSPRPVILFQKPYLYWVFHTTIVIFVTAAQQLFALHPVTEEKIVVKNWNQKTTESIYSFFSIWDRFQIICFFSISWEDFHNVLNQFPAWGSKPLPYTPCSKSKVFIINSYIPINGLCAIAFFDRAWRALREVQAKFRGYSNG